MVHPIFWLSESDLEAQDIRHPPAGWTSPEVPGKIYTLVFVIDRERQRVLLGLKKRGFGVGILNGYGGKVEDDESTDQGARRELEEESGLRGEVEYKGRLVIFVPQQASGMQSDQPRVKIDIALYICESWTGHPEETEEMVPCWHNLDSIPLEKMWPEASLYIPLVWSSERKLAVRVEYEQVSGKDQITGWFKALLG